MNLRKRWLYETLKDIPGIDTAILAEVLKTRPEIGRTDDVIREMHWPRRTQPDARCTPTEYQGVLIHRI